eukprot:MONOS_10630.1-p1 / transcript=MONOS_10630.1 / gene=MONOS_10630 / organism=Monocercomonoides_exilis_PA203 / gene_product=phosphomannomutase D2 / transcript_product=phosphomannomutase D2 / location=Mono_scaffold00491:15236-16144(+) / protein_length=224 / sequence_SO=supercontig / SO=protein_coding / is_pseudo=false
MKVITPIMTQFLLKLKTKVSIGFVGGSDLPKQIEQLGEDLVKQADFSFSENGLVAYKGENLIHKNDLKTAIGEGRLRKFIDKTLALLSTVDIPVKRGTFIEFRNGMINVSPIGRNCSQAERDDFDKYDKEHHIRQGMIDKLIPEFGDIFTFSIGGQISFDVFPHGWDKRYCLQFCTGFDEIHFFGDKTSPGGNDYEIFSDGRVIGHTVKNPEDTQAQCNSLFLS